MKKKFKVAVVVLFCLAVVAFLAHYISSHSIAVFDSKGEIGIKERDLINTASLLMLIVVVPVLVLALAFAWKYRAHRKERHEPDWEHNYIAEYCWWGVPLVIVVILSVITWKSSHELNPFKPIDSEVKPLKVQVVALEWKWLFLLPEQGVAAVNFVQFPENTPINFEITSDAPMNSFWIPQLGGQIYAMPGMRSELHLIASEKGNYRGVSANISGTGFAGMVFTAKASTEDEFNEWVVSVKQTGAPLNLTTYDELAKPSQFNPAAYYKLEEPDLFSQILMKYMQ